MWTNLLLISLLILFILAPFAGLAPLFLLLLVMGIYWSVSSIVKILISGDSSAKKRET